MNMATNTNTNTNTPTNMDTNMTTNTPTNMKTNMTTNTSTNPTITHTAMDTSHYPFLQSTNIASVLNSKSPKKRLLYKLTPSKTLRDGLLFFAKYHIHAAPLEALPPTLPPSFKGILSLTDLLLPLVCNPTLAMLESAIDDRLLESSLEQFKILLETFFKHPIESYMGAAATSDNQTQSTWIIPSSTSLLETLSILKSVRYILVSDRDALIKDDYAPSESSSTNQSEDMNVSNQKKSVIPTIDVNIVDQSKLDRQDRMYFLSHWDVVSFLGKHLSELGNIVNRSLLDLNLVSSNLEQQHQQPQQLSFAQSSIQSINSNTPALVGFRKMFSETQPLISALPIVDAHGKLVGNLSATDIGIISPDNISVLMKPVGEFVQDMQEIESTKLRSPSAKDEYDRMSYIFIVTAQPTDVLGPVLKRLCDSRVHRVWICDEQAKPIGVVSMSDAIRIFAGAIA
jgi:CBS domain-containing protein